ncbi:MAG: protein phosphatase 2C domain-containing protein [Proteobacteria bacterium]|nr:protein phosphatase 2C domain-containing protein [Pseudomonadota bacterium]
MYLSTEHFTPPNSYPAIHRYQVETLLEKGSGALNEDVLLQTDDLFGVFDGATSLDKRKFAGNLTGGLFAARIVAQTFQQGCGNLAKLADNANRHIRSAQLAANVCLNERHRLWSTSLAVVRLTGDGFEYCQTGDALILLLLDDGGYRLVTPEIDIDRETLQLWKTSQAAPTTTIQDLLAEQIVRVRLQMNVSYGVLNGEPEAMQFLRHGFHELAGVSDILLFTDGLFLPREYPLKGDDWQILVDLYRGGGIQAVRNHVRRLQEEDPTCRKYPRFKQHDDIAAVAIQLHTSSQPAIAFS